MLLSWVIGISLHIGDFQAQDIVQDLNRLLDIGPDRNASMLRELFTAFWLANLLYVFSLAEIDQSHAMSCLAALIRYLEV